MASFSDGTAPFESVTVSAAEFAFSDTLTEDADVFDGEAVVTGSDLTVLAGVFRRNSIFFGPLLAWTLHGTTAVSFLIGPSWRLVFRNLATL